MQPQIPHSCRRRNFQVTSSNKSLIHTTLTYFIVPIPLAIGFSRRCHFSQKKPLPRKSQIISRIFYRHSSIMNHVMRDTGIPHQKQIDTEKKVVVIGGGPAGFFAAIHSTSDFSTSDALHNNYKVYILEATSKVLQKVKISGGGRCNVTHAVFDNRILASNYPRGGKQLLGPFNTFSTTETIQWFKRRGVDLKTEQDGRMFPTTNDSQTIVDALVHCAQNKGIIVRTKHRVVNIERISRTNSDSSESTELSSTDMMDKEKENFPHSGFVLTIASGESLTCDRLVIATGSTRDPLLLAHRLGHPLIDQVPSLFTFKIEDPRFYDLAGLSVPRAQVQIMIPKEQALLLKRQLHLTTPKGNHGNGLIQTGPLMVTHTGISGPVVLKLSAFGARVLNHLKYYCKIKINWLEQFSQDQILEELKRARTRFASKNIDNANPFESLKIEGKADQPVIPKRLWQTLLRNGANVGQDRKWSQMNDRTLRAIVEQLSCSEFLVNGKATFKEEFVTAGGIDLTGINTKTMESKYVPHLYFAGEVIDVDGVTGGFNFQNAWTTGYLAGTAIKISLETRSDSFGG